MLHFFAGKTLYQVEWTTQEREREVAAFRALLPALLRTIPIGLLLVGSTLHLLTKWGALLPQAQILWGAAFIGPFLWVVYYPLIHFSKPAIAFKEKGILRTGISSRYIVWKLVRGAKLIRYTDRSGGELVLNFRLNSAERIALPGKTDFDVVKIILQEKLGDKIAFSAQSAPVPTSFLRRLFPNRT